MTNTQQTEKYSVRLVKISLEAFFEGLSQVGTLFSLVIRVVFAWGLFGMGFAILVRIIGLIDPSGALSIPSVSTGEISSLASAMVTAFTVILRPSIGVAFLLTCIIILLIDVKQSD